MYMPKLQRRNFYVVYAMQSLLTHSSGHRADRSSAWIEIIVCTPVSKQRPSPHLACSDNSFSLILHVLAHLWLLENRIGKERAP